MREASGSFDDPKLLISVIALAVSCISALISWRSGRNAARALAISESQEKRRQPMFDIHVKNTYRLRIPEQQVFAFHVAVSNPTDINNSIARAELQIAYVLEGDVEVICRVPNQPELHQHQLPNAELADAVLLPARIDAHQTLLGLLFFAVSDGVIGRGTIDSHKLILEDTHGVTTATEPIPARGWEHEVKEDHN